MATQAVLFDLYGTLVDIWTDEWDYSTYRILCQFLSYYEIFFYPEELAAKYQEKAAEKMMADSGAYAEIDVFQVFEEILAEGWRKQPERALVMWVARLFRSLTRRRFGLFEDSLPVLEQLYGRYSLGIVSDAQWVFSEPEIRILGIERFFDTIVLSSRYFVRKPDPQIYAHALRALRVPATQALYVGNDPATDVPGPQAIGMPVMLIDRFGASGGSVPSIRDLRELPALLARQSEEKPPLPSPLSPQAGGRGNKLFHHG
jgi:putative hydrolase of the HAD superfamily